MPLSPDPAGTKKPRKGLRSQRAARASRASKRGTDGRVGRSSSWSNSSGWRGQSDFGGSTVISPTGVTVRGGSCFKWHWSNVCNSWGGFFATLYWMPHLLVIPKELLGHRLSSIVKIKPWTTLPVVSGYLVEKIKFALYGFPTHQPPTAESKSLLEKLIFFLKDICP
jgi:hypothetical protein